MKNTRLKFWIWVAADTVFRAAVCGAILVVLGGVGLAWFFAPYADPAIAIFLIMLNACVTFVGLLTVGALWLVVSVPYKKREYWKALRRT